VATLVFLHGVGGGHWDRQVGYFTGLGHKCVAWAQPGYRDAPMVDPYSLDNVSAALYRQLSEPAVLVGHSMGGFIAQETYASYPARVKALVLAFTSAAFVGGSDFAKQFVAARIGPLDAGKTMAELAAAIIPALRGTKSDADGVARAERAMAAVPPETYRKAVHLLTTFDRRALLPNIKVPTLIVAGSEDKVAPPAILEKMAKAIPGAEYALLEGCGHLGPMDQPQAFNQAVENFLRKL
jgi:pimeloyl-ACP methyl ester carboxylesterase